VHVQGTCQRGVHTCLRGRFPATYGRSNGSDSEAQASFGPAVPTPRQNHKRHSPKVMLVAEGHAGTIGPVMQERSSRSRALPMQLGARMPAHGHSSSRAIVEIRHRSPDLKHGQRDGTARCEDLSRQRSPSRRHDRRGHGRRHEWRRHPHGHHGEHPLSYRHRGEHSL